MLNLNLRIEYYSFTLIRLLYQKTMSMNSGEFFQKLYIVCRIINSGSLFTDWWAANRLQTWFRYISPPSNYL